MNILNKKITKSLFFKLIYSFILISSMYGYIKASDIENSIKRPKHIIWDLGGVFFKPNKFKILKHIGLPNILFYRLSTGKSPYDIQNLIFDILNSINTKYLEKCNLAQATDKGQVLPLLFRSWLAGIDSPKSINDKIMSKIKELDDFGYFYNNIEKKVIIKTLSFMFNPQILSKCMRPIKSAINVLKDCYNQGNNLYILSNWDSESFNNIYHSNHGQKVFKYFNTDNILISGNINLIKPDKLIFKYFLNKHKLYAQDCIFIDDEIANIKAAQACGITSIHLKDSNYAQLRADLSKLNIIR